MRAFAEAYPDETIVQQVVVLIPWGHNVRILDGVKTSEERMWYIQQTIQYGWSRNILIHQMDSYLYRRQGNAITNFSRVLPDRDILPTLMLRIQSGLLIDSSYCFGR